MVGNTHLCILMTVVSFLNSSSECEALFTEFISIISDPIDEWTDQTSVVAAFYYILSPPITFESSSSVRKRSRTLISAFPSRFSPQFALSLSAFVAS